MRLNAVAVTPIEDRTDLFAALQLGMIQALRSQSAGS